MSTPINRNPGNPLLSIAAGAANAMRAHLEVAKVAAHTAAAAQQGALGVAMTGVGAIEQWRDTFVQNAGRAGQAAGQLATAAAEGRSADVTFTPATPQLNQTQRRGAELLVGATEAIDAQQRAAQSAAESYRGALDNYADAAKAVVGGVALGVTAAGRVARQAAEAVEAEAASGRQDAAR